MGVERSIVSAKAQLRMLLLGTFSNLRILFDRHDTKLKWIHTTLCVLGYVFPLSAIKAIFQLASAEIYVFRESIILLKFYQERYLIVKSLPWSLVTTKSLRMR